MKKINSFLTLLLLAVALPASAQLSEFDRCIVESIGEDASTEITADTQWYLIYNAREYYYSGGGYWWDPYYDYETGSGTGQIYMSYGPDVVYEEQEASEAAAYLVRFLSTDADSTYYLQFGTGNYVWAPSSNSTALQTVSTQAEATPLELYLINEDAGHWALRTLDDNGSHRIDNNGTGATVVTWDTDDPNGENGNNDWKIYPVTLSYVEDETAWAELQLATVYAEYVDYVGYFKTEKDTYGAFGCYSSEAVEAFETTMAQAGDAIDTVDGTTLTADEMNAIRENIESSFQAVLDSYMTRATDEVEDGYYYLNNALQYYVTTTGEDTEDPETGDPIPGETVTDYYVKGMYSEADSEGDIYALWDTHEEKATFLWHVTSSGNGDKTYSIVNAATGATFDNVAMSTNVTMTVDGENLMVFDRVVATDDDGNEISADSINYAIRVSTQSENSYYYLHCGGHSNGAGTSGNIVGWSVGAGASQWWLVKVADEDAQELIDAYNDSDEKRWNDAQSVIADAQEKMTIAEDLIIGTDGLITSVDQLSSPYTEPEEGSLEEMIDGDASTYWHSQWEVDGVTTSVEAGTHYFQVELNPSDDDLVFVFTRRQADNDHITLWGVYGTNDANAGETEDDCTLIAEIETPYTSYAETLTSSIFNQSGYTYLRFYCEDCDGANYGCRGYFHVAEFQLYTATVNKTSQMVAMGSVYTDLEAAVAAAQAEGDENEGLSKDTYNTLMSAYEAFIAMFVDPTELRTAISDAEEAMASVVTGKSDPGYWTAEDTSLNTTITAATSYDAAGKYTQTESDTYVAQLTDGIDGLMSSAISIKEGEWYKIRYANEDEMDEYGWATSNAKNDNYDLVGTYLCVADAVTEDDVVSIDALSDLADVCVGQQLHFVDLYTNDDAAMFRFVNVGDSAYMIQNKGTGLFIRAAGESGAVSLSAHPTLFNVTAAGYGENIISGVTTDGENCNNLHAQLAYQVLVTWAASTAGTNSGLYIEDTDEAVADSYEGTDFNIAVVPGTYNFFCFGTGVKANEGTMYGVQSVSGTTITLKEIEGDTAEPGQPFVFVNGTYDETETETEPVSFTHDYTVAAEAQIVGEMVGVYYSEEIGAGKGVASGDAIVVSTSSDTESGDNGAYISTDFDTDAELTIVIDEDGYFDSIEEAVAATAQDGNIYTIDGKLVGKGNLNKVKTLGKGIYILNGAKILVK